jgi:hypothetical protein
MSAVALEMDRGLFAIWVLLADAARDLSLGERAFTISLLPDA